MMIEARGIFKSYKRDKDTRVEVLKDFHMHIFTGEILGVVGPSGCGKSTLARCLMGMEKVDKGEITIREGAKCQMIFQDSASAFNPRMTLGEIILEPLVLEKRHGQKKLSKEDRNDMLLEVIELAGLEQELLARHPYDVSGGQRQRAAIARALIIDPDFIIADEPIASLDISIQAQIIHLLKELHQKRNLTMMLIAHDLHMVEHISDRIITMKP